MGAISCKYSSTGSRVWSTQKTNSVFKETQEKVVLLCQSEYSLKVWMENKEGEQEEADGVVPTWES